MQEEIKKRLIESDLEPQALKTVLAIIRDVEMEKQDN